MKIIYAFNIILMSVGIPFSVCAETVYLKDGTTFEATDVSVEAMGLKVKNKYGEISVPKEDLTPELIAKYFPVNTSMHFTFESKLVGEKIEYSYYISGKQIALHKYDQEGNLLSSEGELKDGAYKQFYEDGALKKEQVIINGVRNGPHKIYYPNGKLQSETYYLNDIKYGFSRVFDERGGLITESRYVNGKPVTGDPQNIEKNNISEREIVSQEQSKRKKSRRARIFATLDYFTISGADGEWKKNLASSSEYAVDVIGYDSARYELSSTFGLGGRIGVHVPYEDEPRLTWGASIGYVLGPSAETNVTASDNVVSAGYYDSEVETSFTRFLLELTRNYPIGENSRFSMGVGAGLAQGTIEEDWRYSGSFVTVLGLSPNGSAKESWSGFTWELSPSIVIASGESELEFGARIAGFPKLEEGDTFSEFAWTPFSVYAGIRF